MFALNIPHFSSYSLTIEEKTALKYLVKQKKITPLHEEKVNEQFSILMEMAKENGFVHYEISNFAKEGFYAKHNTAYWQNKHYLGVGPSAHSFNGGSRSWNVPSNKQYILKTKKGEDISKRFFNAEKSSNEFKAAISVAASSGNVPAIATIDASSAEPVRCSTSHGNTTIEMPLPVPAISAANRISSPPETFAAPRFHLADRDKAKRLIA